MLQITERVESEAGCASAARLLKLPYELRIKSRLRARLDDGAEVGLILPRGTVLRHGDRLRAEDGTLVLVVAAAETVSTARTDDLLLLARSCYHLGNRHVPLQIGNGWVRYLHDHVLDAMVRQLGVGELVVEQAPFEPEAGAYGGHAGAAHEHHH